MTLFWFLRLLTAFRYIGNGWTGTAHFIDPSTGVAAVFGTQTLPTLDVETWKAYPEFENALYAALA